VTRFLAETSRFWWHHSDDLHGNTGRLITTEYCVLHVSLATICKLLCVRMATWPLTQHLAIPTGCFLRFDRETRGFLRQGELPNFCYRVAAVM